MAGDSAPEGIAKTEQEAIEVYKYKPRPDLEHAMVAKTHGQTQWRKDCSQLAPGELCAVYACWDHVKIVVYCNNSRGCDKFYELPC